MQRCLSVLPTITTITPGSEQRGLQLDVTDTPGNSAPAVFDVDAEWGDDDEHFLARVGDHRDALGDCGERIRFGFDAGRDEWDDVEL